MPTGRLFVIFAIFAVVMRLAMAYNLPGYGTDMDCFRAWANNVYTGGIENFYTGDFFADYPPIYIYILYFFGFIRNVFDLGLASPMYGMLLHLPAIICDVAGAYVVYRLAKQKFRAPVALMPVSYTHLDVYKRQEYEGYFDSVKSLFKQAKKAPEIRRKIKGVLAEVIDVPKKYETPIEVILGNALQNVVVEEDTDAKDIIAFLRKNNLGRVTFLPTKALKVRYLQKNEKEFLALDGVECVASEAIDCAEEIRPAVDFLLGRTVIVRDMDSAIRLKMCIRDRSHCARILRLCRT